MIKIHSTWKIEITNIKKIWNWRREKIEWKLHIKRRKSGEENYDESSLERTEKKNGKNSIELKGKRWFLSYFLKGKIKAFPLLYLLLISRSIFRILLQFSWFFFSHFFLCFPNLDLLRSLSILILSLAVWKSDSQPSQHACTSIFLLFLNWDRSTVLYLRVC